MRAGWIRPSEIRRLRAVLAISRRMGSKHEMTTASGVSSMMMSTPVSVSRVRMLRPSRPMIRPFISSLGRLTVVTVTSEATSVASRWIVVIRTSRAFLSAREPRLLLDEIDRDLRVVARLVLEALHEQLLRLRPAESRDPLQFRGDPLAFLLQRRLCLGRFSLPVAERPLLLLEGSRLAFLGFLPSEGGAVQRAGARSCRSRVSFSSWLRSRSSWSLLSSIASFFFASASLSASLTTREAFCSADES